MGLQVVMSDGQLAIGFSLSLIVTVNEHVLEFPEASVAIQFTVVIPTGNMLPETGKQETEAPGQLSVADATYETTALHRPASFPWVMFAGQLAAGFSVSNMVTVNEQVFVLPAASVAVQVTVETPTGNVSVAGKQAMLTPGQLSVAKEL